MEASGGSVVQAPGEGKTVSFSGHQATFLHAHSDGAYSLVRWTSAPEVPGTPLHIHRVTDEAFYVLEGTFGFQADDRTFEASAGAFVFVPQGAEHAYWNAGATPATLLMTISPAGFERYFEELSDGLQRAADDA